MSRILLRLLTFLGFAICGYAVLLCAWGELAPPDLQRNLKYKPGSYGHLHTRAREARRWGKVDVVCFGSSHCYRNLDVRIFAERGLRAFNLGSSSQTPLQTEVLVDRYLDGLEPGLVVYMVSPRIFALAGVESTLDLIANDRFDPALVGLVLHQRNLVALNTLGYAAYRRSFGRDAGFSEPRIRRQDEYVPGGYVAKHLTTYRYQRRPRVDWHFRADQLAAFTRVHATLRRRGIRLVLVRAPVVTAVYAAQPERERFAARMRAFGTYLDVNRHRVLEDMDHFFNADHLNRAGVEVFDRWLLDRLQEMGALAGSPGGATPRDGGAGGRD